eukprot:m.44821 g.44821  ORF g.44821 m.44821 type:complete len:86 (+) comp13050_c0_seq3:50-307(+)
MDLRPRPEMVALALVSRKAWSTLAASCVFAVSMIAFVHVNQKQEREALREGVIRDLERQERKRMNKLDQDQQIELRKQLEAEQSS